MDSVKYLTYEDYQSLGGTLDLKSFNLLEYKSRKQIDNCTFGRLMKGIPEDIKEDINLAMYNLISINNSTETNANKNISSESIDGYSIQYGGSQQVDQLIQDNIKVMLSGVKVDGVPLLYAGDVNDYKQRYYPIS